MTIRTYLTGLLTAAALCWTAFVLTVANTNPNTGGQTALVSFYVSLTFALIATVTLLGYIARVYLSRNEVRYAHLRSSFRQSFLVAGLVVILLLLQAEQLLAWWDVLLLSGITTLIELYLRAHARPKAF